MAANVAIIGDSSELPALKSVITCFSRSGPVLGLDFSNITLSSLVITGCGHTASAGTTALVFAGYVSLLSVTSCAFKDNRYTSALYVGYSTLRVKDSSFTNNTSLDSGAAVWTQTTQVDFQGSNCFAYNVAPRRCSAISAQDSVINFDSSGQGHPAYYLERDERCLSDATSVVNNTVAMAENDTRNNCCGGAVCMIGENLDTSQLTVTGRSVWTGNVLLDPTLDIANTISSYFGGAFFAEYSIIVFNGNHTFSDNHAGVGGAVYIRFSAMNTLGNFSLRNNSAFLGGGMYGFRVLYIGEGLMYFSNNCGIDTESAFIRGGSVKFDNSTMSHDSVSSTGAMDLFASSVTLTGNMTFTNNTGTRGAALYMDSCNITLSGTTLIQNNRATVQSVVVFYLSRINISGNFTLINSSIVSGLLAIRSNGTLGGNVLIGSNGGVRGGGLRLIRSNISLQGSVDFLHNTGEVLGGAINSYNSTIGLSRQISFANNSSPRGGAVFLQTLSTLVLNPPLQLYAQHNSAEVGAAIFVEDIITYNTCLPLIDPIFPIQETPLYCFFYVNATSEKDSESVDLIFENNTASVAGTTLYGGMLDSCTLLGTKSSPDISSGLEAFLAISETVQSDSDPTSPIASDPLELCFCYNNTPSCSQKQTDTLYVRRGQPFSVSVVALGQANGSVPTIVRAQFPTLNSRQNSYLGSGEGIQESGVMCTELQYSLFSSGDSVDVTVFANGPCRDIGNSLRTMRVSFLPCHLGFQLSGPICICDTAIQQFTNSCDVADGTIERSAGARFWIGVVRENDNTTGLVTHPNCPFNYCTDEQIRINLNDSDDQCAFNRTGTLCGGCSDGLSLTLGIARCQQCSNVYLALLLPLALAGVLLVAFILYLQLTVAVGTINGLILYANIVAVNSATLFPSTGTTTFNISRLFIAWLNLDLGINTCFYDGMDTIAKIGLQFVFSVYVWLLVGAIIVWSHYSTLASRIFGRNPVAVLSTLVLLSYTKLLRTIIAIFPFTVIEYPDNTREAVWLYDANIWFLSGAHIVLFLVALIVLVFLFLPYTLYLTFGQCIIAQSKMRPCYWISGRRLRPFLDAYHAPFKPRHRYWFGVLLLVRCVLFLVTAFKSLGTPVSTSCQ